MRTTYIRHYKQSPIPYILVNNIGTYNKHSERGLCSDFRPCIKVTHLEPILYSEVTSTFQLFYYLICNIYRKINFNCELF